MGRGGGRRRARGTPAARWRRARRGVSRGRRPRRRGCRGGRWRAAPVLSAISTASAPEIAKKTAASSTGAMAASRRASSTRAGWACDVAQAVEQLARSARRQRRDDAGMAVADRRDAEAGGEIDVAVAVDVEDVGAARLLPDDRPARRRKSVLTAGASWRASSSDSARDRWPGGGATMRGSRSPRPRSRGHGPQISRRPASERPRVTSSVYSMSPPTGMPKARRVTRDAARLEQPREVERRRLALDVGVGGEDHLLDAVEAAEEAAGSPAGRVRCRAAARARRAARGRGRGTRRCARSAGC